MRFTLIMAVSMPLSGCFQPTIAPEPVPDYCALTSDVRFTQEQFDLMAEHAAHILRYLIEQRETRLSECAQ